MGNSHMLINGEGNSNRLWREKSINLFNELFFLVQVRLFKRKKEIFFKMQFLMVILVQIGLRDADFHIFVQTLTLNFIEKDEDFIPLHDKYFESFQQKKIDNACIQTINQALRSKNIAIIIKNLCFSTYHLSIFNQKHQKIGIQQYFQSPFPKRSQSPPKVQKISSKFPQIMKKNLFIFKIIAMSQTYESFIDFYHLINIYSHLSPNNRPCQFDNIQKRWRGLAKLTKTQIWKAKSLNS